MDKTTYTDTNVQSKDLNSLSHSRVKIGERVDLVTGSIKVSTCCHVWLPFMYSDTISDQIINIKHVYLHVVSVTRPISCKSDLYNESYNLYRETVQDPNGSVLKNT